MTMNAASPRLKRSAARMAAILGDRRLRIGLGLALIVSLASATSVPPGGKTIGLVVTDLRYALYQTSDGKEECPAGLQAGEVAQFKAMPGAVERMKAFGGTTQNRGQSGELANYSPLTVDDPLPWNELGTKKGSGLNLDGTPDGHATAKTCRHDKFTDAQGAQVDNQMARVLGCVMGWRKNGFSAEFYSKEVETSPFNRQLIEISGVDDEQNDPSVEVTIYKGRDRIVRTPSGTSFIPFMSHRIDDRFPQYVVKTHGMIVDGVLITDPIPLVRMPLIQIQIMAERRMHDMSLRLKLKPDGAQGLMAGYENLDSWWNVEAKSPASDIGRYSPALLYKAAHRYADGYPDPKTHQCTAISTVYDMSAVRAFIVRGSKEQPRIAMARQ
jgi:hypothetical protein